MKYLFYILPLLFFSQLNAQSYSLEQGKADFQKSMNVLNQPIPVHIQKYFDIAIDKIDQISGNPEEAIEIAITDFLKCQLSKKCRAFYMSTYLKGEYDPYEINEEILSINVFPLETTNRIMPIYYIAPFDTLGSTRLPTRHIIKEGKLFFWNDPNYGLTEDMIKVLMDYNIADLLENSEVGHLLGQEWQGIDERTKGADYYFCKDNLNNYKRVITSTAAGWYAPPKLKCKHKKSL